MASPSGSAENFEPRAHPPLRPHAVALAQAVLYVATGVWPLVHMRSFEAVTGRKRERWLFAPWACLPLRLAFLSCGPSARVRLEPPRRAGSA